MKKKVERQKTGPVLEALTHRLAQCPREFLYEPRVGNKGRIPVDAVVSDLYLDMTGKFPDSKRCDVFTREKGKEKNWLRLVLVASWLLNDKWFLEKPELAPRVLHFLQKKLQRLADVCVSETFVSEPERREELSRYLLACLGFRPEGETKKQAEDRLGALDSVERIRVMLEAKRAEEHAKKVREAMKKRKAREAAAKVMRE